MERGEMYYKGDMEQKSWNCPKSWDLLFVTANNTNASAGLDVECRINPKDEMLRHNKCIE